jgi:hypothetical protein
MQAEVFLTVETEFAASTRMLEPGDPDTVSLFDRPYAAADPVHDADHLVAGNDRLLGRGQIALDDV